MFINIMKDFRDVLKINKNTQRTEEWYTIRENLLTASDVASAIDLNPYKSKKQLLLSKVKPQPKGNNAQSEATLHGNYYEDIAIQKFSEKTGHKVHDVGLFIHPVHTWLGGSPDGLTETCELIEVKCPLTREIKHEIPEYYYPQVQVCMEILDIDTCYFIQFKPESDNQKEILDILQIDRSKEWFEKMLPKMKKFWDSVLYYRNNPHKNPNLYGFDENKVLDIMDISICQSLFIDEDTDTI